MADSRRKYGPVEGAPNAVQRWLLRDAPPAVVAVVVSTAFTSFISLYGALRGATLEVIVVFTIVTWSVCVCACYIGARRHLGALDRGERARQTTWYWPSTRRR